MLSMLVPAVFAFLIASTIASVAFIFVSPTVISPSIFIFVAAVAKFSIAVSPTFIFAFFSAASITSVIAVFPFWYVVIASFAFAIAAFVASSVAVPVANPFISAIMSSTSVAFIFISALPNSAIASAKVDVIPFNFSTPAAVASPNATKKSAVAFAVAAPSVSNFLIGPFNSSAIICFKSILFKLSMVFLAVSKSAFKFSTSNFVNSVNSVNFGVSSFVDKFAISFSIPLSSDKVSFSLSKL